MTRLLNRNNNQRSVNTLYAVYVGVDDDLYEWSLSGNDRHPFHIHINSFQLSSDTNDPDGYYVKGDWHDVLFRPSTVTVNKIHFSVDQHTGKAVLHCHFLEHEDKGYMAHIDITGADGAKTGLAATALASIPASSTPATDTPSPPALVVDSKSGSSGTNAVATTLATAVLVAAMVGVFSTI